MRWLLMLGAGIEYTDALDAALVRLRGLGEVDTLTPVRITAARDGGTHRYHNRLLSLEHAGPQAALIDRLKRIEHALGRGTRPGMPLDIDLLASDAGDGWTADARALEKREFDAVHVRDLLAEAGLDALLETARTE